jgi:hypothetical protein
MKFDKRKEEKYLQQSQYFQPQDIVQLFVFNGITGDLGITQRSLYIGSEEEQTSFTKDAILLKTSNLRMAKQL